MSKQENDLSKELSFGLSSKKTFSNEQQTSLIGNTIINTNISDDGTLSTIYFYVLTYFAIHAFPNTR